jgi:hypothetical protein
MKLTKADLNKLRTKRGGYTRKQIELLGFPWPPIRGWHQAATKREYSPEVIEAVRLAGNKPKFQGMSQLF